MKQLEREPDALEAALRDQRASIPEDFAARLDAWAAEGFPPAEDAPVRGSVWGGLRRRLSGIRLGSALVPAAGLAVALVALVAGINALSGMGGSDQPDGGDDAVIESTGSASGRDGDERASAPSASAEPGPAGSVEIAPGSPTIVPPEPGFPGTDKLTPAQERIQERSVTTTLSTEPDEVAEVADAVVEVTERYEGIVTSSNVSSGDGRGRASFALRIPAQSLRAFLADLSDLATVSSRNEGTLDITAPFVSAEERFGEAKAEVDSLVAQLSEADSVEEIASLKLQLSSARATLATVRAELAQLKQRADFAQVGVTVVGDGDSGGWSLGDAVDDALSVLEDLAGATLVALAVIVPLGAVAIAVAFATGRLRRRRRESALDD
jgi:hypothetical protein